MPNMSVKFIGGMLMNNQLTTHIYDDTIKFSYNIVWPKIETDGDTNAKLITGTVGDSMIGEQRNANFEESFIDADFEESVLKADKLDYLIAACSGMLTAGLDLFWRKEFSLLDAQEWGEMKAEEVIFKLARSVGYKGTDLPSAIHKLEESFKIPADSLTAVFGGGKQHHLRDFEHHPSLLGLFFSILTQFTKKGYGTDTSGAFISSPLSDDSLIGKDLPQKVIFGVINWVFHLASDMAGSSQNAGEGAGISGPLLSIIKELSALPLIKEIQVKSKGDDIMLSKWISKLYNGTCFVNSETGERIKFDLRTEMGIGKQISQQAMPVILNECVVRAFYMVKRLHGELKTNKIVAIRDLEKIGTEKFLPYNQRSLTRMLTVATGVFVLTQTSGAVGKAAIKGKGNKGRFAKKFLLEINFVGIGRFIFACKADSSYITEEMRKAYNRFIFEHSDMRGDNLNELQFLLLSERQARILYSLQLLSIEYDIEGTKKIEEREAKHRWKDAWRDNLLQTLKAENESFFLEDEELLRAYLQSEIAEENITDWLYLLALELLTFEPYYPLAEDTAAETKKLKKNCNFEKDFFCTMQHEISWKQLKEIQTSYELYQKKLSGANRKLIAGAATTAAVTAATGGLAVAFAPQIAVVLAGGSFAGLSGAALTSASLAAIGGGALTAGGLGMAGGTAIIAGGGVLIGLTGSSAISLTAGALLQSKGFVLHECAKLLAFCEFALSKTSQGKIEIKHISKTFEENIIALENCIKNTEHTKTSNKEMKNIKTNLKYLKKCKELLAEMLKKA